jgi:NAD(P)H-quinone oxidoreductase subunit 5
MEPPMNTLSEWSSVVPAIGLGIPAVLALAALASPRRALLASGVAWGLALLFTAGLALLAGAWPGSAAQLGVQLDVVTCVMLLLVSTLGVVIVRYSRTYLAGEPGLERYQRWLLLTLSAVTALIVTNNLAVMILSWTATSLALHQLLTFYSDRAAALVAAHKKFLVSRLAELCLLACIGLVLRDVGSLDLSEIATFATAHPELTPSLHLAAVLVVLAVALKSAQLPFHGWLTQVMEAPTPVSALLHAGVVNIGGLVLIRLSPWMAQAEYARLLLVVIGMVSAVVAALVMTTRVSVKVALAWSTCAQLGFMLVQCGLGLWHLALLHLVAHSLYKAHAFLSAGSAVDGWRLQNLTARPLPSTPARLYLGGLLAAGLAIVAGTTSRSLFAASPAEALGLAVLALVFGLSLSPWWARRSPAWIAAAAARMFGIGLLYGGWHWAAAQLLPTPPTEPSALAWTVVGAGFVGLFVVKAILELNPEGRLARVFYPWLYGGLFLDERFTRLTFRIWPPRLATSEKPSLPVPVAKTMEVAT